MTDAKRDSELDELEKGWDEDDIDPSDPDLAKLDADWEGDIDDLFKDEEEDEEDEEPLPDERLDPVAFAAAKKAREERLEMKRARRKAKLVAKKLRLDAKRAAMRGKQKQKQKPKPKPKREPTSSKKLAIPDERPSMEDVGAVVSSVRKPDLAKKAIEPTSATPKGPPWKLIALVLVVFVAAAAAVAAVTSR